MLCMWIICITTTWKIPHLMCSVILSVIFSLLFFLFFYVTCEYDWKKDSVNLKWTITYCTGVISIFSSSSLSFLGSTYAYYYFPHNKSLYNWIRFSHRYEKDNSCTTAYLSALVVVYVWIKIKIIWVERTQMHYIYLEKKKTI